MDLFEALYTTRAMRRMKADPVPLEVQARIMDAAIRAPSGGNMQNWRFLLVDDPDVRGRLTPLYQDSIAHLWTTVYAAPLAAADAAPEDPGSIQLKRVVKSAQHLADHFAEVPLFLFAFAQGDPSGGSIFPAVWSAQLAARAEGVGSALTTVLAYFHRDEAFEILGVPGDKGWIMSCCVAFGYPTGRWGVAARRPVHEVTHRNQWGAPAGFEVPDPLWSPGSASGGSDR
jgi:nitroreductase